MSDEAYRAGHGNWPRDNFQPTTSIEHDRYIAGRRQREWEEQQARDRVFREQREQQDRAAREQRNRADQAWRDGMARQAQEQRQRAWQPSSSPSTYGGSGGGVPAASFTSSGYAHGSSSVSDGGPIAWLWRMFVRLVKLALAIVVLLVVVAVAASKKNEKPSVPPSSATDELVQDQPAALPQDDVSPRAVAPEAPRYEMITTTVNMWHQCAVATPIYIRFFDETYRGATWPANDRTIVLQPGQGTRVSLPCSAGDLMCVGASTSLQETGGYSWGKGLFRRLAPAAGNCFTCAPGNVNIPAFACGRG